jgi:hypothetical protein
MDLLALQALQYDQTAHFTRLPATSSGNIYVSTFPNSPGLTHIVRGTNIGGRSQMLLVTLAKRDVNLIGIQASNRVIMVEASPYKPVVISM